MIEITMLCPTCGTTVDKQTCDWCQGMFRAMVEQNEYKPIPEPKEVKTYGYSRLLHA